MKKRPRINMKERMGEIVVDPEKFIANKGSDNAKKVDETQNIIHIDIWHDKHFEERHKKGEDNGIKREGIEPEIVKDMLLKSLNHIFHYSANGSFSFLNMMRLKWAKRLVLQSATNNGMLNVVVEFYYVEKARYEATIVTAICKDDFQISDGQFMISMDDTGSRLYRRVKGKVVITDSFSN
ncbi:hypothetical protein I6I99_21115 [Sphingobacterium multivorum]|nr:hypothetical protein [Sphingobacterium multivorum]QQT29817.1 hypothetical protein I6I99_21115 [Sphingobacterium multivorum]